MGKRVAIIGSRDFSNLAQVRRYVETLPKGTIIVSGGAQGVDKAAEDAADARGLQKAIHRVSKEEWDRYGKAAGPLRNARLVKDADIVIAFWTGEIDHSGTWDAIRKANKMGKKVVIYPAEQESEASA